MSTVRAGDNRAAEAARRARHAQRTPFLKRVIGNPTVEILREELARSKGMGYGVPNATGADRND